MTKGSLAFRSAVDILAEIHAKRVTSREVLELYISRVERYDGDVNAVVIRDFDRARTRADAADAALLRGESWGPLHGLPITVKENNDVSGLETTCGFTALKGTIAEADAACVARLIKAGAVILGKTNLPVGVNDTQAYNPLYGCTNNPHDLKRTPGGSSGGSAAALCAGFSAGELGGDIGGSIRVPAHCCGLWGLKPTYEIISRRGRPAKDVGVSCGDPSGFVHIDLVVKGPLSRHPDDLALMLDVLAGPEGAEARAWQLHLPRSTPKPLSSYKIAVWGDDPIAPVDSDIKAAVSRTVDALRAAGVTVEEARPDFTSEEMFDTYLQLLAGAESVGMTETDAKAASLEAGQREGESDEDKQARWIGQSYHAWWKAHGKRLAIAEKTEHFFASYDFILQPCACNTAWVHDHSEDPMPFWKANPRILHGANGHTTPYHKQVFWAALCSGFYLPSVTFPAGVAPSNGLPTGLQIIGKKYSDYDCIDFAKRLAEAGGEAFAFKPPAAYEE